MPALEPHVIWPRPQEMHATNESLKLNGPLRLKTAGRATWLRGEAKNIAGLLNRKNVKPVVAASAAKGKTLSICSMDAPAVREIARADAVAKPEGYILMVNADGVLIAGNDAAGAWYGAQTLARLLAANPRELPGLVIRDWPEFPVRGAHVYVPPRAQMGFLERFLDYMASLKCNTLFMEIGGGMEYERHPEVNLAWIRFVRDAYAFNFQRDTCKDSQRGADRRHTTAGPNALAGSRYGSKDSIHPELAGGDFLTKAEMRQIVESCRARHIEIIPEVQSLSHSYYLTMARPEIAERSLALDPWPDCYCPQNPKSYELYFDVLEEVIEVFKPRMIHIGHDELDTIAECPRCRKMSPHKLLAGDITKIHDFLKKRGIRTMMWGDTLMKRERVANAYPRGGSRGGQFDAYSNLTWDRRDVWRARDMVPKDIAICDWYWGVDRQSEKYFKRFGFNDMIYGNFTFNCPDFAERVKTGNVHGMEVSTWCETNPFHYGHNRVTYDLFGASDMVWHGEPVPRAEAMPIIAQAVTPAHDVLSGRQRWMLSPERDGKLQQLNIKPAAAPLPAALRGKLIAGATVKPIIGDCKFKLTVTKSGALANAIVLDAKHNKSAEIRIGKKLRRIITLHATTMKAMFQPTYGFYNRGPADILRCVATFADGAAAHFNAFYGDDIGPLIGTWPAGGAGYCHQAVPVRLGETHTLYAQELEIKRRNVAIKSISFYLGPDAPADGEIIIPAVNLVI